VACPHASVALSRPERTIEIDNRISHPSQTNKDLTPGKTFR